MRWKLLHDATRHDGLRFAARTGFIVSGVIHLLIAYLIARIACGSSANADPSGALATVAASGGGEAALWGLALAMIPLTLWRLAEALIGLHPAEGVDADSQDASAGNRLKALGLMVVYCGVGLTAIRFALGDRQPSGQQTAGLSARLMQSGAGRAALIAGGVAVVVVGGYHAYKGASKRFLSDLTDRPKGVAVLGGCGYVVEGLVLAIAGGLVVKASVDVDPAKAAGLDAAVKTLAATRIGMVLLALASFGFAAYGLYSFALSRYSRM
ncbi:DUF1206 domain-containing protein [Mycobacterium asiaticum]|uniref:DUF1206 domain-containing protein n=1 Tax=Mycobacterium asiaticum TaxID=1790 RepID=A0A1A3UHE8_MYCAS|nr:DUF1206 domain-containing protein [Mycobacterium asiaticum]OBK25203.1 hypothetical protein A5635_16060 [Mycobacterium asiaticum]OBK94052.1 hypothetical protein A5645_18345 [Mycobacterium asiaticum]